MKKAKHSRNKIILIIATIALCFGIGISVCATLSSSSNHQSASSLLKEPYSEELIVRFLNVEQGDCALISCADHHLLIDGGPSGKSSKIYAILKTLNITHLDAIICTHPDADHCGGIAGALNYATCETFYCSTTSYDTKTFNSLIALLKDIPITIPSPGDSFFLEGSEACITFVGPVGESFGDSNNASLVCRIDYGNHSFLFTGDAEEESENRMLSSGVPLWATVLKVGHHGSADSTSTAFLKAVNPTYAVISVGENSYGHPTEETLERLKSNCATIYRTDEDGEIIFKTDGVTLSVRTTTGYIDE